MPDIRIAQSPDALAKQAAELFVEIANAAITTSGQFAVALSGGLTPKAIYRLLSADELRYDTDWSRIRFFIGDERNVPADDERNNFRMVNEALFRPLKIREALIFRWKTEINEPEAVASDYQAILRSVFSREKNPPPHTDGSDLFPRFDLVLLGLGADGHTASLFPHTKALHENEKLAVANWVPQMDEYRFTMTFPVINNAANVMFLVSGDEKAATVRDVIEGEYRPDDLPAQRVRPDNGELFWMLDEAAAALLSQK